MLPSNLLKAKIKKPKLLRSNPFRKSSLINGIHTEIDDEDVYVNNNRLQVTRDDDQDEDLSDDVKWKLFLARQAAVLLAMQKWGA